MTRYALIEGGAVATVTNQDDLPEVGGSWVACGDAGPGWLFDGMDFTPPSAAPVRRHITVGAFFDRFGPLKYDILASTEPAVRALIKDCEVRHFIDLDNEALPVGLALLQSEGFAVDADAVINAPIEQDERP